MDLYRRLRFPRRAENLKQFSTYQVSLDHWEPLSTPIRDRFEGIYERGDSAIVLLHGPQSAGKTLFCDRLAEDFQLAAQGAYKPDANNLWHKLVGGDPSNLQTIRHATSATVLRRIQPDTGWLATEKMFAVSDQRFKVRLFLMDDAQLDFFLCELAQFDLNTFRAHSDKPTLERAITQSLGQNFVRLCRNEFQRSLFILASNRTELFASIHEEIERSDKDLALLQALPLPTPEVKERIIRTNTNRLNNVSYWFCLDATGPDEKKRVFNTFKQPEGFMNSFVAVDEALKKPRKGPRAHRNTLTLVTLGSALNDVRTFIDTHLGDDSDRAPAPLFQGTHLAYWQFREWASRLVNGNAEEARRAELLESEFCLLWIALDPAAVVALCADDHAGGIGQEILRDGILKVSSNQDSQVYQLKLSALDTKILPIGADTEEAQWWEKFRTLGQKRSSLYEPQLAIRVKAEGFNYGVAIPGVDPEVRPDVIVSAYKPCAVTTAPDETRINEFIRRDCHTVEFTSFLGPKLDDLEKYILGKAVRYAAVLESL